MNAINMNNAMLAIAADPVDVSVGDSLLIALIGILIVIAVLVVLMITIQLTGYLLIKSPQFAEKHPELVQRVAKIKNIFKLNKKKSAKEVASAILITDTETNKEPAGEFAKGTLGELTLINTEEREAAMIMAIVADATETPLNELRFKSIKLIEGGDNK